MFYRRLREEARRLMGNAVLDGSTIVISASAPSTTHQSPAGYFILLYFPSFIAPFMKSFQHFLLLNTSFFQNFFCFLNNLYLVFSFIFSL